MNPKFCHQLTVKAGCGCTSRWKANSLNAVVDSQMVCFIVLLAESVTAEGAVTESEGETDTADGATSSFETVIGGATA